MWKRFPFFFFSINPFKPSLGDASEVIAHASLVRVFEVAVIRAPAACCLPLTV